LGRFEGKNVFVTGVSKGIGKEISKAFAKEGARVVLASKSEKELEKIVKELKNIKGDIKAYPLDVTKKEMVKAVTKDIVRDFFGYRCSCKQCRSIYYELGLGINRRGMGF